MVTMHSKQHQKSYAKLNTQRFVLGCNNYFICLLLLKRTILLSVSPGMLWEVDVQTSQAPKQCVAVRTQEHWLIWLDLCEDTGSLIDQVALPYVRTQGHWLTDLACLVCPTVHCYYLPFYPLNSQHFFPTICPIHSSPGQLEKLCPPGSYQIHWLPSLTPYLPLHHSPTASEPENIMR